MPETLEQQSVEKFGKWTLDYSKSKTYLFKLSDNKKVKPMGVSELGDTDPPYPKTYMLANPVRTFDPVTKKPRIARCLKGVDTIWLDEQTDLDEDLVKSSIDEFTFNYGDLYIAFPQESNRYKFMLAHVGFEHNKTGNSTSVFYIQNDDEKAEQDYQKMLQKQEAVDKVSEVDYNDLKELSDYYNIKLVDKNGDARKETAVRLDFAKAAEQNPDAFLKAFNNVRIKVATKIKKAIADGLIDLEHTKGQAHWGDTKGLITVLEVEKDPVEQLVEVALSNDKKGKDLQKKLGL